jgi:Predicted hydrolases or acyltransferases (alpha/beta hydrolase superfamily)
VYRYLHVGSVRLAWNVGSVRLAWKDFGGEGPAVLLLHGLFGRATTWEGTAAWLRPHFRVVGLDQRGHGLSDKPDGAYSRDDGTTA